MAIKLTADQKIALESELIHREQVLRPRIKKEVVETAEAGDLFYENDSHARAVENLEQNEHRIAEIKYILSKTKITEGNKIRIEIGSKVALRKNGREEMEILLVDNKAQLADSREGKISSSSPLGLNLIGKQVGDKFIMSRPSGNHYYEILAVN